MSHLSRSLPSFIRFRLARGTARVGTKDFQKVTFGTELRGKSGTYRGYINTQGVLASIFEKKLGELSVLFCSQLDHSRSEFKYGIGLAIGQ